MSRTDLYRATEHYSRALAPVIGPFLNALADLAQSIDTARHTLRADATTLLATDDTEN